MCPGWAADQTPEHAGNGTFADITGHDGVARPLAKHFECVCATRVAATDPAQINRAFRDPFGDDVGGGERADDIATESGGKEWLKAQARTIDAFE